MKTFVLFATKISFRQHATIFISLLNVNEFYIKRGLVTMDMTFIVITHLAHFTSLHSNSSINMDFLSEALYLINDNILMQISVCICFCIAFLDCLEFFVE